MQFSQGLHFSKGHGTANDFIILDHSINESVPLLPSRLISALCHRRTGLGADGLIRIATARQLLSAQVLPELPAGVTETDWFMDYYNSDGSIAEMCGNGARVFAHYLHINGYEPQRNFSIGTRAGRKDIYVRELISATNAQIQVEMGQVRIGGSSEIMLHAGTHEYLLQGTIVDVGNPHLACIISDTSVPLSDWDLHSVTVSPQDFPHGANLEIIYPHPDNLQTSAQLSTLSTLSTLSATMRVYERGCGETASCGTGVVAAARAVANYYGKTHEDISVTIYVPGGELQVEFIGSRSFLSGPSQLVATGVIADDFLGTVLGAG